MGYEEDEMEMEEEKGEKERRFIMKCKITMDNHFARNQFQRRANYIVQPFYICVIPIYINHVSIVEGSLDRDETCLVSELHVYCHHQTLLQFSY